MSTFGFIAPSTSAESSAHVSGSYGLFDAMAALRWVRSNIDEFGGNKKNITLFGQSAGASVITLLMISPLAQGLYDKVILESPGSMRHIKNLQQSEQLGLSLGSDIAALRALPATQVPLIQNLCAGAAIRALFQPRVIGGTQGGCVIPTEEREAFESGSVNATPSLVGSSTNESIGSRGRVAVGRQTGSTCPWQESTGTSAAGLREPQGVMPGQDAGARYSGTRDSRAGQPHQRRPGTSP
ncbi:MAG: carboxylesterase family protein [Burkholderiales bacterium]